MVFTKDQIDAIARVCHEANRAHCFTIGDFSQKPYDEAEEWQRQSARDGVKFATENTNVTAAGMHREWSEKKIHDGWKYGPVKDAEKKEHPALVPYENLPINQRVKDAIFLGIVRAYAPHSEVNEHTSHTFTTIEATRDVIVHEVMKMPIGDIAKMAERRK